MLAITIWTRGTRSVRSFQSNVETVLGEVVDSRGILRDNWNGVEPETIADLVLLGPQDDECVLPIQDFSGYSE